jgi:hypothetical protein
MKEDRGRYKGYPMRTWDGKFTAAVTAIISLLLWY